MEVIHSICSSYHWSLKDAMHLTMPQIMMLSHAAWKSSKQLDAKWDAKRERDKSKNEYTANDPAIPEMGGMRMSELSDEQRDRYLSDWSAFA